MKKLLPLIFVTLLLAGCASQGSTENSVKDDSGTKMTASQLFEKKKECGAMYDDYTKYIKTLGDYAVDEIFYSPVLNTCIGTFSDYSVQLGLHYFIDDILTKEEYTTPNGRWTAAEYKAKIKELKGE